MRITGRKVIYCTLPTLCPASAGKAYYALAARAETTTREVNASDNNGSRSLSSLTPTTELILQLRITWNPNTKPLIQSVTTKLLHPLKGTLRKSFISNVTLIICNTSNHHFQQVAHPWWLLRDTGSLNSPCGPEPDGSRRWRKEEKRGQDIFERGQRRRLETLTSPTRQFDPRTTKQSTASPAVAELWQRSI